MYRFMLIALAAALALPSCKAEFKPTGVSFHPGGVPEDVAVGDDSTTPPADVEPDQPTGPKTCEEIWDCVLSSGCELAPHVQDSVCLKKCVGDQGDEQVQGFLELKECAAGACATEPNGDAVTQCSYQFCTNEWLSCVAAGDGTKTCGDMHRCLIEDCGPDYTSAHCVSSCLRDGDQKADQDLSLMTKCTNLIFFNAAPLECTGVMARCYAGSHEGKRTCRDALMCEVGCYETLCPNPGLCHFEDLVGCFYDCLWGLDEAEVDRMTAIQQCLVSISHEKLVEDDVNIYSHCALQAHECLGMQDQFATCSDAYQCIKEHYNYFLGTVMTPPAPFWFVARECLVDVIHEDKEPLTAAILCLQDKYEGGVQVVPWAQCKDSCPTP